MAELGAAMADPDAWDDTALVEAYDAAMAEATGTEWVPSAAPRSAVRCLTVQRSAARCLTIVQDYPFGCIDGPTRDPRLGSTSV